MQLYYAILITIPRVSFLILIILAYEANTDTISLDYVLLRPNEGVKDSGNGNVYMSLFEAQLDAVFAALDALNFSNIKVIVSETGWPSAGGDTEYGVGAADAAAYNGNLVRRVLTGGGQEKLQSALDYACGEGGVYCKPIQSGETCFHPDTLEAHASYAFKSYYQRMSRAGGSYYYFKEIIIVFLGLWCAVKVFDA
ncbi:hypothetical protein AgCh_028174 [Apium graveolens]